MGPRSDERGNGGHVIERDFHAGKLQWGRARMSAEMNPRPVMRLW